MLNEMFACCPTMLFVVCKNLGSILNAMPQGYQLSMTRALGHSMLSDFGVIWTPSVRLHRLAPGDCCLILASDGVWDVRAPYPNLNPR